MRMHMHGHEDVVDASIKLAVTHEHVLAFRITGELVRQKCRMASMPTLALHALCMHSVRDPAPYQQAETQQHLQCTALCGHHAVCTG